MATEFKQLKKRILIIDDMKLNFTIIKKILEPYPLLKLDYIQDPREAMNFIESTPDIDLIILDWEMPHLSGPDLCKILKNHETFNLIPIIFCTANPSAMTIAEAFEIGAQEYINKPICNPEFLARIYRIFQTQELSRMLEKRYEEKNEITRILSHDLSNYLSIVTSSTELNKRKAAPEDTALHKHHDKVLNACLKMADLIKNVRDFQAAEDKSHSLIIDKVRILDIINEAISNYEEKIKAKEINIKLSHDSKVSLDKSFVWAEKVSLLNSVLGNVISNAIKFSKRGDELYIDVYDHDQTLDVIIKDRGIGIPQELLKKVFDKTAKTSRTGTENEPGTGFGMPLIKLFMESYGGRIQIQSKTEADSTENHGTSVILEFKKCA